MHLTLTSMAVACGIGLAACSPSPGTSDAVTTSPQGAPSGVTSSNGGGQRQLGDIPNVSFNQNGAYQTNAPASRGAAY